MLNQVQFKLCLLLATTLVSAKVLVDGQENLKRVYSEVDESSCVCGLNKAVLDRLELLIQSSSQTCSSPTSSHLGITTGQSSLESTRPRQPEEDAQNPTFITGNVASESYENPAKQPNSNTFEESNRLEGSDSKGQPGADKPELGPVSSQHNQQEHQPQKGQAGGTSDQSDQVAKLTAEIHKLEQQFSLLRPSSQHTTSTGTTSGISTLFGFLKPTQSGNQSPDHQEENRDESLDPSSSQAQITTTTTTFVSPPLIDTGFLGGLSISPTTTQNEALIKLNQSQSIDPQEMTSALQSTVPNVVSNIFSNIQNLTIQTEQQQKEDGNQGAHSGGSTLTSIDGSSVDVKGDSADQITAEGEKLFMLWIEHQISSLHLTATMANRIRKSAISLFRRIVKQYVQRIAKLGGSLEDNVRRATQIALNNTQNLIAFLLRNYLYFAAGIMQIIGEQVSRVGKQLDSTGDTIAHLSLNPFDIVSKVIDSLPNPSDYSNYFREMGKHLMGELTGENNEQSASQTTPDPVPKQTQGLIIKTMGALGKKLSSWMG